MSQAAKTRRLNGPLHAGKGWFWIETSRMVTEDEWSMILDAFLLSKPGFVAADKSTSEPTVSDGFGNEWMRCPDPRCDLHVVRPGKVQCSDYCAEHAENPARVGETEKP